MQPAMNGTRENERAIALHARVDSAQAEAAAARRCLAGLVSEATEQRARADLLAARLARIERLARYACGITREEVARAALGAIALSASEPVSVPAALHVPRR